MFAQWPVTPAEALDPAGGWSFAALLVLVFALFAMYLFLVERPRVRR
jgi:hypothetical protein